MCFLWTSCIIDEPLDSIAANLQKHLTAPPPQDRVGHKKRALLFAAFLPQTFTFPTCGSDKAPSLGVALSAGSAVINRRVFLWLPTLPGLAKYLLSANSASDHFLSRWLVLWLLIALCGNVDMPSFCLSPPFVLVSLLRPHLVAKSKGKSHFSHDPFSSNVLLMHSLNSLSHQTHLHVINVVISHVNRPVVLPVENMHPEAFCLPLCLSTNSLYVVIDSSCCVILPKCFVVVLNLPGFPDSTHLQKQYKHPSHSCAHINVEKSKKCQSRHMK